MAQRLYSLICLTSDELKRRGPGGTGLYILICLTSDELKRRGPGGTAATLARAASPRLARRPPLPIAIAQDAGSWPSRLGHYRPRRQQAPPPPPHGGAGGARRRRASSASAAPIKPPPRGVGVAAGRRAYPRVAPIQGVSPIQRPSSLRPPPCACPRRSLAGGRRGWRRCGPRPMHGKAGRRLAALIGASLRMCLLGCPGRQWRVGDKADTRRHYQVFGSQAGAWVPWAPHSMWRPAPCCAGLAGRPGRQSEH